MKKFLKTLCCKIREISGTDIFKKKCQKFLQKFCVDLKIFYEILKKFTENLKYFWDILMELWTNFDGIKSRNFNKNFHKNFYRYWRVWVVNKSLENPRDGVCDIKKNFAFSKRHSSLDIWISDKVSAVLITRLVTFSHFQIWKNDSVDNGSHQMRRILPIQIPILNNFQNVIFLKV